eukprot:EC687436.1.p1 GENE.EC687436.1~~EC687436.1.p1  ORF type:complete len:180 (+),score=54.88 EC687436.1:3-542(+)
MSNEHCTAHVLSESSLFVYRHKLMVKTCGTTTLLRIVPAILAHAERLHMSVQYVFFSRKAFMFPHEQLAPHTSFEDEVRYLNTFFTGSAFILGPLTGDHWNVPVRCGGAGLRGCASGGDARGDDARSRCDEDASVLPLRRERRREAHHGGIGDRSSPSGIDDRRLPLHSVRILDEWTPR